MSGVDLTTISPSSTSSSRRTPWVDGCCGPIEIVICVSRGRSTISNCGGMSMVDVLIGLCSVDFSLCLFASNHRLKFMLLKLFQTVRFITSQRKILSQRMALPVVRQENAAQVRMTVKDHAEQIISLSLVPIRRSPDS